MSINKQTWTIIYPHLQSADKNIILVDDEYHYIVHVLRLTTDNSIELANGKGLKAYGIISSINKKQAEITITDIFQQHTVDPQVHLCLAYPKPGVLPEIIASISELGCAYIHLFKGEKSAKQGEVKLEKLQRISNEAMRISKSAFAAEIKAYANLHALQKTLLQNIDTKQNLLLFCDEEQTGTLPICTALKNNFNDNILNIFIFIGPEASFTSTEREFIKSTYHAMPVSLGSNILRVHTAAVNVASSVLNYLSARR